MPSDILNMSKVGFNNISTVDQRQIILHKQGTTAYDISLVHWSLTLLAPPADTLDGLDGFLSMREVDYVRAGTVNLNLASIMLDSAVFAHFSVCAAVNVEGAFASVLNLVIPYPKPFRVPFLSVIANTVFTTDVSLSVEVFYDEQNVTAAEMAYLKRVRHLAQTAPS